MKYGARNQITGKVARIKTGDVMCQVTLNIDTPAVMNSVMTVESLNDLGIKTGDSVKIIARAVNVLLVKE